MHICLHLLVNSITHIHEPKLEKQGRTGKCTNGYTNNRINNQKWYTWKTKQYDLKDTFYRQNACEVKWRYQAAHNISGICASNTTLMASLTFWSKNAILTIKSVCSWIIFPNLSMLQVFRVSQQMGESFTLWGSSEQNLVLSSGEVANCTQL